MPRLAAITIYPIKSLPGMQVTSARVLPSGALEFDRRWALVDGEGQFVNAKRTANFHTIAARFDLPSGSISLAQRSKDNWQTFRLPADAARLEEFLSQLLAIDVRLVENDTHGLPDDTDSPGPTVISQATLATVAGWFVGMSTGERFRANLEITDVEPFWEDRLVGPEGQVIPFRIGSVELLGTNPCQRCIVPTRDPHTGEVFHGFSRQFSARRESQLPPWAVRERFTHFYRLAVNTQLAAGSPGGVIQVGEEISLR